MPAHFAHLRDDQQHAYRRISDVQRGRVHRGRHEWRKGRSQRAAVTSPAGTPRFPRTRTARPWTGDKVFSSGDLIEDLTHNFFLETVARQNKLRVYEIVEHPAAKALTKMFPTPRIETAKIPECQPHIQRGDHKRLYRFSPDVYKELTAVFNGTHPEPGDGLEVAEGPPEDAAPNDLPPQPKAFVPDPHP